MVVSFGEVLLQVRVAGFCVSASSVAESLVPVRRRLLLVSVWSEVLLVSVWSGC